MLMFPISIRNSVSLDASITNNIQFVCSRERTRQSTCSPGVVFLALIFRSNLYQEIHIKFCK